MSVDYIIVQAGGKGTRLGQLTANKPKALVPVENLPMLFHLFKRFPNKRYIIIADYKREVLRKYLECFAEVKYRIVDADGKGTLGGLKKASELIPDDAAFMLIWSDLILHDTFQLPDDDKNYVGISETFECRWKYENKTFAEEKSVENGVAGLFIFRDKEVFANAPQSGEFVCWLKDCDVQFEPLGLSGMREFGTLDEYNKLSVEKTRPFNKMTLSGKIVIKEPVGEQGKMLARRETAWYKFAQKSGFKALPEIYGYEPLTMERVDGKNVYELPPSIETLKKIVNALKALHSINKTGADAFSVQDAYYSKTMNRLDKIRNLVPFSDDRFITINGKCCKNVFYFRHKFERLFEEMNCVEFSFIHGDCTFSNTMLNQKDEPVFIDPRGYFGFSELYGDSNYDWAKLYYSIVGNYDSFNLKDFTLNFTENTVAVEIASNGWECLEQEYFKLSGADEKTIKLLHAIIWLSLTTYAWQDYDSICGAFYNGLYYLEECW